MNRIFRSNSCLYAGLLWIKFWNCSLHLYLIIDDYRYAEGLLRLISAVADLWKNIRQCAYKKHCQPLLKKCFLHYDVETDVLSAIMTTVIHRGRERHIRAAADFTAGMSRSVAVALLHEYILKVITTLSYRTEHTNLLQFRNLTVTWHENSWYGDQYNTGSDMKSLKALGPILAKYQNTHIIQRDWKIQRETRKSIQAWFKLYQLRVNVWWYKTIELKH